jgi:ketosteroid isomerase-like protein
MVNLLGDCEERHVGERPLQVSNAGVLVIKPSVGRCQYPPEQLIARVSKVRSRSDKQNLLALSAEDIEPMIPGEDWPLAGTYREHAGLDINKIHW